MATVLDWLLGKYPDAKRTTLKRMVEAGRVLLNGRPATKLKQEIPDGAKLQLLSRPAAAPPPPSPLNIVYEDADILVVNKPPGLLTSTVAREKRPTLLALVRQYLAEHDASARPGLIHRLDRDASGLLIFSKNHTAFESIKLQFFEHSVHRVYAALVHGRPPQDQGRIHSRLVEYVDGSVHSTPNPHAGHIAITDYAIRHHADSLSLLCVTLHTGRKHQIRAHLSELGNPIVGDAMYGSTASGPLMLAAVELGITHPRTGQRLKFELPLPAAMQKKKLVRTPASPAS